MYVLIKKRRMPYQHVFLSLSAFIPDEVSEIAEISQEELDDGVKLKLKVDKIPSDAAIKRQLHRRDAMRLVLPSFKYNQPLQKRFQQLLELDEPSVAPSTN